MVDEKRNVAAAIETVKDLHRPQVVEVTDPITKEVFPLVFAPKGLDMYDIKAELDQWGLRPRRLQGTAKAETLQSFCALVVRHKVQDTALFATSSGSSPTLTAVIDYHEARGATGVCAGSRPSFAQHRIAYSFPKTSELLAWEKAGGWKSQQAFARFLDDRRFELVDPLDIEPPAEDSVVRDVMNRAVPRERREGVRPEHVYASPADIMLLVETLSASTRTKWQEVKTDRFGGVKVFFEKGNEIQGNEAIPTLFLVEIAAFVGGPKLVLPARLKAVVQENALHLSAELVGVERVLERAFSEAIGEVVTATQCQVFRGSPES